MVGGHIIENKALPDGTRRLWVMDGNDECVVRADSLAGALMPGETVWWQSGEIMARNDTFVCRKIGNSASVLKGER